MCILYAIFTGQPVDGIEVAVDKSTSQEPAGCRERPKGDTAEMQGMRHMHCVGLGENISLTVMAKAMERYSVFKPLFVWY